MDNHYPKPLTEVARLLGLFMKVGAPRGYLSRLSNSKSFEAWLRRDITRYRTERRRPLTPRDFRSQRRASVPDLRPAVTSSIQNRGEAMTSRDPRHDFVNPGPPRH
ncbi:MAG: hypothetical protein A3I31_02535 [Candidatus Colwellbacteria bacterium RIFCSPLOWO2_02_FULL_44_20b]|uniref:Uncharacterized protein n=1 Tax=Candidatus Colwellbacteria bacterium RIFCSPLOWO2_02_FULL_44_20b TaxID=1797691 RepID=A0A1G1Z7G4_9BACT|nr:MAG: hypothetical protein A3I31_02535 [Candidatus Colwellbacteria bacterium RIFCSPLOWO2_02_FULL_44_20b]